MTPEDAMAVLDVLSSRGITLRRHGNVITVTGPATDADCDLIAREARALTAALRARAVARRAIDSALFLSRRQRSRENA